VLGSTLSSSTTRTTGKGGESKTPRYLALRKSMAGEYQRDTCAPFSSPNSPFPEKAWGRDLLSLRLALAATSKHSFHMTQTYFGAM